MSDTLPEREDQMTTIGFCAECQGYTHVPWCPSYKEPDTRRSGEVGHRTNHEQPASEYQPAARGGGDGPVFERVGSEILIHARNQVYRFHWQDADLAAALYHHLRSSQTPAESADLNLPWYWMEGTNRILADANSQGQKFVICDMLDKGPKGVARARYAVEVVNQHQSLGAERERLETLLNNITARAKFALSTPGFIRDRDGLQEAVDAIEQRSTSE